MVVIFLKMSGKRVSAGGLLSGAEFRAQILLIMDNQI